MNRINYKLEDFEGPLDLLLALIQKNKMSIADIEIITIINQYLDVMEGYGAPDADTASEFIEMAARLVYLKSVYLLPRDEEGEKLKAELQGQLTDYSLAKYAANLLRQSYVGDKIVTRRAAEVMADYTYRLVHPISELTGAYSKISGGLKRSAPQREDFEPILSTPLISVSSKIYRLLKGLMKNTISSISQAFRGIKGKSEAVATFLALLELVKAQRVLIGTEGELELKQKEKNERIG